MNSSRVAGAGSTFRSRVSAVRFRVQVFSTRFRFGTCTRTRTRQPVPDARWPRPGTWDDYSNRQPL